jgi:hypothetical protein
VEEKSLPPFAESAHAFAAGAAFKVVDENFQSIWFSHGTQLTYRVGDVVESETGIYVFNALKWTAGLAWKRHRRGYQDGPDRVIELAWRPEDILSVGHPILVLRRAEVLREHPPPAPRELPAGERRYRVRGASASVSST